MAKIVGTYEYSVQKVLAGWSAKNYDRIDYVGCENGDMLVCVGKLFPGARLTGYDLNDEACKRAKINVFRAALNDRVTIKQEPFTWHGRPASKARALMICDIEGSETELFAEIDGSLPDDIIVELHEFVNPDCAEIIKESLSLSHNVWLIDSELPPMSALRSLSALRVSDLASATNEGRPVPMRWLIAERKASTKELPSDILAASGAERTSVS